MHNIKHRPIFDTGKVEQHYTEKDGVPVQYVCTSAIQEHSASSFDIFYIETPHPEFGNRYFGLYHSSVNGICITNADNIENLTFHMIEVDGQLHYSQHRHDFYSVGDVSIDGGRSYIRLVGNIHHPRVEMKIRNGKFEEVVNV